MEEVYVSFEVAKLLQEKQFNEGCFTYYKSIVPLEINHLKHKKQNSSWKLESTFKMEPHYYSAPTHQMAMKWLRNEHDIDMWVEYCIPDDAYVYTILIKNITEGFTIIHSEDNYPTYEEATEAGLKYSLENLI